MWFGILSLVLGITLLTKGSIGLLFHDRFYNWDKEQYRSRKWPKSSAVFIPYGILMITLTWYATLYHYVQYGWILTLVISLSGLKLISIVFYLIGRKAL